MPDKLNEGSCTGTYVGYDLEGGSSYRSPCWRRCGCELPGCPAIAPPPEPVKLHILSQEGQPYGSARRCCNHCGVSLDPAFRERMAWGEPPPHVDNWTDWREAPNNCRAMERT